MIETVKVLQEIGLSPVSILVVLALVALWKVMNEREAKQVADREAWHAETRAQVEKLEAHTKACDEDRIVLRTQVEMLKETVQNLRNCPKSDCPKRLP